METALTIIDNFYENPDGVRDLALSCEYYTEKVSKGYPNGNAPWPGKMSKEAYSSNGIDAVISKHFNKNLRQMRQMDSGHFRISQATNEVGMFDNMIHADSYDKDHYAGVLYLSKGQESTAGTLFYRQNSTGLDRLMDKSHLKDMIRKQEDKDASNWTVLASSNIIYNRLLIYPAYKFHGIGPCFGDTDENARIVQLFNWIEIT
jgi:hypothetical protein